MATVPYMPHISYTPPHTHTHTHTTSAMHAVHTMHSFKYQDTIIHANHPTYMHTTWVHITVCGMFGIICIYKTHWKPWDPRLPGWFGFELDRLEDAHGTIATGLDPGGCVSHWARGSATIQLLDLVEAEHGGFSELRSQTLGIVGDSRMFTCGGRKDHVEKKAVRAEIWDPSSLNKWPLLW